ncbi:RNA-directed DNA polymerase-like protein [Gossypium australe]|uniref:RNA-directed DNA polymerase-like protein n=1 Tax=Gossypium australe TaxID=47621 RepID=A0A5B6X1L5_9ROSI|nr:RNA-directed DNA polymerase-like protein [Gossypium australe]
MLSSIIHEKANVVTDALSRRQMTDLRVMFSRLSLVDDGGLLAELQVKPTLDGEIKEKQSLDVSLPPRIKRLRMVKNRRNEFRSRKGESDRIAKSIVKATEGSGIVEDHHHTTQITFWYLLEIQCRPRVRHTGVSQAVWLSQYVCPVLARLRHMGLSEAVGGTRPAHTGGFDLSGNAFNLRPAMNASFLLGCCSRLRSLNGNESE